MAADIDRRYYVEKMYSGPAWKQKVKRMSDGQIFAIYMREKHKQEAEEVVKKVAKKVNKPLTNDDIPF